MYRLFYFNLRSTNRPIFSLWFIPFVAPPVEDILLVCGAIELCKNTYSIILGMIPHLRQILFSHGDFRMVEDGVVV